MKRNKQLERYVKRFTGKTIKAYVVKWFWGGYGGFMDSENGVLKIRESELDFKALLWHEMGHLMVSGNTWVENEVNAQMWAFKELKRRGYINHYKENLEWVKRSWGKNTERKHGYAIARNIILKKLGEI